MNKAFPYFGGKQKSCKILSEKLPYHKTYIEVFGGGASLLFYKRPSYLEVYNDVNYNLYNFFKCVRDCPKELQEYIDRTPISRALYELEDLDKIKGKIERASLFWFRQKYSNMSKGDGFCPCLSVQNRRITVKEYWERVKDLVLENKDFGKIIDLYDRDTSLFYLDPPYYTTEKEDRYGKIYNGATEWDKSAKEHKRLYEKLRKLKGKFILSYNDCPEIMEMYKEYNVEMYEFKMTVGNRRLVGNKRTSKELIIWNY